MILKNGFNTFLGLFETKFVTHTYFVANFGLEVPFSHFLYFLVGYKLWTYTSALLGHFKHFLGVFEIKFVTLTHLMYMYHEVLFSHFLKF